MAAARCPIGNVPVAARHRIASLDPSLIHARPRVWAAIKCCFTFVVVQKAGYQSRSGNFEQWRKNKGMPSLLLNMPRRSRLINQRVP